MAVMRISGPETMAIMAQLAPNKQFKPRQAQLAKLYAPKQLQLEESKKLLLDEALVLLFKGPKSYTGEDSVELYLHGSPTVSKAVQQAIISTKLARVAEPGEFTKRAFHNNRLDLSQVEGIRDLLAAETEQQRQASVGGAAGMFTKTYDKWRAQLVFASGMLAANIDFAEDNDFTASEENDSLRRVRLDVEQVRGEMEAAVKTSGSCAELVKEGLKVALLGEPNAGKSSLTNKLVQRAACLVSDIPGTTRDVLEIMLEVGGHKVVLYDTAGIRNSNDQIEMLGIERAREAVKAADFVIALDPKGSGKLDKEIAEIESQGKKVLRVESKSDLNIPNTTTEKSWGLPVSSTTGEGMDELIGAISSHCDDLINNPETPSAGHSIGLGMSNRARALLENEAIPGLDACLSLLYKDVVLSDAELQRAVAAIGAITGTEISAHEVLGVVFGEFCIGK